MTWVTLAEAKAMQRIDGDDEDGTVQLLLDGAVAHCLAYLNCPLYATPEELANGDPNGVVFNADIKTAMVLVFGYRYTYREDVVKRPHEAERILDKYRKHAGL